MSSVFYQTETPDDGLWKFVKVNGQIRWLPNMGIHKEAVEDGETAEAAGTISIFAEHGFWQIACLYSSTLKIGLCGNVEQEITDLLGLPKKESW